MENQYYQNVSIGFYIYWLKNIVSIDVKTNIS